jgi:predicted Fe-S protein YdhL (DUF1289 family)
MNQFEPPALPDFDPFADAGAVPSPCIDVCRMNPRSGLCEGCFRTIDEIMQWSNGSESFKRSVWVDIYQRRDESEQGGGSA